MSTIEKMPLADEYRTLREACGLVDRSERGKLALTGTDAVEFLNGQVTNDVARLRSGEGCYAAFLTHKGKMLGDLRVLATDDELLLDTERTALQALFDMIRRFKIGYEVELHKRTLESGLLSLIGPGCDEVARRALSGEPALSSTEHSNVSLSLAGTPVRLVRTDVGIDALVESTAADGVRAAMEKAGAVSVSEAAAEIVRVENGTPRYGVDMDESTIPEEAGLNERAVSFTKGCYVGQETVARLHYKGKPNRLLRGLICSEPLMPGAELRLGEREIGRLTSSALSPALGPIGLALIRIQAQLGMTVSVGEDGINAVVAELPFL